MRFCSVTNVHIKCVYYGAVNPKGRRLMIKIAIIDTGIDSHNNPTCIDSLSGIGIKCEDGRHIYVNDYSDSVGHGTVVFNILAEYLTKNVEVFSIKIFDSSINTRTDLLVEALRYCDENLECQIIQISLGTLYSSAELHDIISKLYAKGICIVSAFDNDAAISYPAAYEEVIGVDINYDYKRIEEYDIIDGNIIDIRGPNAFYRTHGLNDNKIITQGSSFYCSYVVAKIVNMNMLFKKSDIINEFKHHAKSVYSSEAQNLPTNHIQIHKAIVFPFNKEIHSIAAFEDLLDFEIVNYYDIRQKGLLGRSISSILHYTNNSKLINDYASID